MIDNFAIAFFSIWLVLTVHNAVKLERSSRNPRPKQSSRPSIDRDLH